MPLFDTVKSIPFVINLAKVTIPSLVSVLLFDADPAIAFGFTFENPGFEGTTTPVDLNSTTGWRGTGDAYIDNSTDFTQVSPVGGSSSQALITTGRHTVVDDPSTALSTFNFSGSNPKTATSNDGADDLQDFLEIPTNSLSISRSGSADDNFFRTAKEGSAIYQDITVSFTQPEIDAGYNIFEIDFNWAYLSNDGVVDPRLGEQDFAFFTVYDTSSAIGDRTITVLDSSDLPTISVPHSGNNFQDVNTTQYSSDNIETYTSPAITSPGTYTYRVGFGVVDVDGLDRTSALLLDSFDVRQVPFDFSPASGIGIIFSLIGFHHFKHRIKRQS